ncbi:hypothetical protein [Herbiconiux daphne]|uniref:Uncharacterized protein n=1 Tax=Herbiconiux daphne TaxID=2970914 RepID=A0ABT2H0W6_9MICO|nr:hypothetical protein [Herbiconiux daphne]MCS5733578.1 hypothetical protein [Herbiconiux daphne]
MRQGACRAAPGSRQPTALKDLLGRPDGESHDSEVLRWGDLEAWMPAGRVGELSLPISARSVEQLLDGARASGRHHFVWHPVSGVTVVEFEGPVSVCRSDEQCLLLWRRLVHDRQRHIMARVAPGGGTPSISRARRRPRLRWAAVMAIDHYCDEHSLAEHESERLHRFLVESAADARVRASVDRVLRRHPALA